MQESTGAFVGGTADEFMAKYAAATRTTVAALRQYKRVPFYISECGEYPFPHWEMGRETDDWFDRRNEIAAPKDGSLSVRQADC